MIFYTRRLAALLCFSVQTIALGINCRGSGLCPRASFLNNNDASIIQTLRDVVHATSLPDTTVYSSGDHIVCVSQSTKITISPSFQGEIDGFSAGASIGLSGSIDSGGICLFPQGASLTLGSIKPLTDAILDHKCTTCGSVPIHFVDEGSNDPGAGILTFNYVAAPTCDRNCIRSLGSPDSGKSPSSSQPAQQPSGTLQQQPQKPSNTPVQQPTTQASVTPVTTQPRVTEPLTVIQQPFTSPSEPEPVTIIQTPSSASSDSSSSSGSGGGGSAASGSDDDTGSSADSGGEGGVVATTPAVNSATQQVVTVVSTQTSDQQGSAASATPGGDQDAGAAAAGPSTVTVAPGSSTAAAGGGVVTVTGGSTAATPSGNAGTSGQGAIASASPSSGLGVPGSARMADFTWLYIVIPMAALF
ncbi:MAG: hypothetical protein OHK93_001086 [Ramalina farinacea]|uniref:Killer toxin Kp4 domain-containing protein n=1 Tax=Ramalina farinacea TaxID=258253 RepID=A0AA43TZ57_9LECA|nr:hypothetical protein [Ramalina farinacea]